MIALQFLFLLQVFDPHGPATRTQTMIDRVRVMNQRGETRTRVRDHQRQRNAEKTVREMQQR